MNSKFLHKQLHFEIRMYIYSLFIRNLRTPFYRLNRKHSGILSNVWISRAMTLFTDRASNTRFCNYCTILYVELQNIVIKIKRLNVFNEINLLVIVVTLVDEVLVPIVLRVTTNGTIIDIINNTATANPPKNEQRQAELVFNEHILFLFLEMMAIVYWRTY